MATNNAPQVWTPAQTAAAIAVYSAPPWEIPPDGSDPFDFWNVIDTPAAGSAEVTALSWVVPAGYRAVIRDLTHVVQGPDFGQGSGDIIWRLQADKVYIKNYGELTVSFGDIAQPRAVYGIRLAPRQTFYYRVKNVGYANAGTKVICNTRGWFYPEVPRS